MDFWIERMASPIGTIRLVSDGEALRALDFSDCEERMLQLLRRQCGDFRLTECRAGTAARHIKDYFDGDLAAPERIAIRMEGSAFQRKVWAALRKIPAGETSSYGRLAAAIGAPGASRAVGLANGANPIAIVVPCHRVIGADGSLTGYGGGLSRKAWLLRHEGGGDLLRHRGQRALGVGSTAT